MNNTISVPETLVITHNAGFFSCCTIHLLNILKYFNTNQQLPQYVDSKVQFSWYKEPQQHNQDIKPIYFDPDNSGNIVYTHDVRCTDKCVEEQFVDYKYLNFDDLKPFINRYFSPSLETKTIIQSLEAKYNLLENGGYANLCVLFHRGNDKKKEVELPSYDQYITDAKRMYEKNPHIRFLIQSDETEFITRMAIEFPENHIIFKDEIRHMSANHSTTVDHIYFGQSNHVMSKYFVAITYIMSKCQYVMCGSGNCSFWIALFRGNAENIIQYCAKTSL